MRIEQFRLFLFLSVRTCGKRANDKGARAKLNRIAHHQWVEKSAETQQWNQYDSLSKSIKHFKTSFFLHFVVFCWPVVALYLNSMKTIVEIDSFDLFFSSFLLNIFVEQMRFNCMYEWNLNWRNSQTEWVRVNER